MDRRQFLGALAVAALGTAGVGVSAPGPETAEKKKYSSVPTSERRRRRFRNVALTTHEGKQVRFYDDLIKGKTVLMNFFYTNCSGESLCPMATANLARVQKLLGKRVGKDIFIYSITLDPEHDTPTVLKRYARGFGAGPGWLFLTGEKSDIENLRRSLGDVDPDPAKDREKSTHTGMLRYGIEPLERWAACASLTKPEWIVKNVSRMEPGKTRTNAWIPKGPAAPAA
jgi:protein SCO1/2